MPVESETVGVQATTPVGRCYQFEARIGDSWDTAIRVLDPSGSPCRKVTVQADPGTVLNIIVRVTYWDVDEFCQPTSPGPSALRYETIYLTEGGLVVATSPLDVNGFATFQYTVPSSGDIYFIRFTLPDLSGEDVSCCEAYAETCRTT